MSCYPRDWPKCACGAPVLDGHATCGDAACGTQAEAEARRGKAEAENWQQGIREEHEAMAELDRLPPWKRPR